jgi:hypothetical protein
MFCSYKKLMDNKEIHHCIDMKQSHNWHQQLVHTWHLPCLFVGEWTSVLRWWWSPHVFQCKEGRYNIIHNTYQYDFLNIETIAVVDNLLFFHSHFFFFTFLTSQEHDFLPCCRWFPIYHRGHILQVLAWLSCGNI